MEQLSENAKTSTKIAIITALSCFVADVLVYPLDTIATRLKGSNTIIKQSYAYILSSFYKDKKNLKRSLTFAFWAGFVPNFAYFFIYDCGMKTVENFLQRHKYKKQSKLFFPFFVSGIAEVMSLILYLPMEIVRTRMQMNSPEYNYASVSSALRQIYQKQGFFRFYKSSKIYFASKILQTSVSFQSFQIIRYLVGASIPWMIFNTIFSVVISTTITNPLQVLITRYALRDTTKKKLSLKKIVKQIYHNQGIRGFYKAYSILIFIHSAYALFMLPIYQFSREQLHKKQHQLEQL